MKPADLRPQVLSDQQGPVRYDRREAGERVAMKVAKATNVALDQIELDPAIGSPRLEERLGIPGVHSEQVVKVTRLWFHFGHVNHLDVAATLDGQLAST